MLQLHATFSRAVRVFSVVGTSLSVCDVLYMLLLHARIKSVRVYIKATVGFFFLADAGVRVDTG